MKLSGHLESLSFVDEELVLLLVSLDLDHEFLSVKLGLDVFSGVSRKIELDDVLAAVVIDVDLRLLAISLLSSKSLLSKSLLSISLLSSSESLRSSR